MSNVSWLLIAVRAGAVWKPDIMSLDLNVIGGGALRGDIDELA